MRWVERLQLWEGFWKRRAALQGMLCREGWCRSVEAQQLAWSWWVGPGASHDHPGASSIVGPFVQWDAPCWHFIVYYLRRLVALGFFVHEGGEGAERSLLSPVHPPPASWSSMRACMFSQQTRRPAVKLPSACPNVCDELLQCPVVRLQIACFSTHQRPPKRA